MNEGPLIDIDEAYRERQEQRRQIVNLTVANEFKDKRIAQLESRYQDTCDRFHTQRKEILEATDQLIVVFPVLAPNLRVLRDRIEPPPPPWHVPPLGPGEQAKK